MIFNILAVGLMGTAMALSPMQPRYVVDNQNDTLTFSAEELNNNTYEYLAQKISNQENDTNFHNTSISYNNKTYTFDEFAVDQLLYENQDEIIYFAIDTAYTIYGKWSYNNGAENATFTASMTINNAEWFIANIEEPPSLTLSKYDLNNKKYTYLAEKLNILDNNNYPSELTNSSITYNNVTFTYENMEPQDKLTYLDNNNNEIGLYLDEQDTNYGQWYSYNATLENNEPFTGSITINNAEWFLQNINAPLDSGDMMTAITSGLPLMANLAQAFLNGFTSIFWNSTTNTLTTFSNFALIMLSVAIVFACIKLVLNLVRSNTGV